MPVLQKFLENSQISLDFSSQQEVPKSPSCKICLRNAPRGARFCVDSPLNTPAPLKTLIALRNDAFARGLSDLALAYGWSIMRILNELLAAKVAEGR